MASLPAPSRPGIRHEVVLSSGPVPYREYGSDGPAVVMLHGLRGDHHGLEPIVSHLPGFRVLVPDLPGFGETGPLTPGPHDLAGYAAWTAEFVATVAPGAVLLGHSFGAIVASAAVADGLPVRALVLVTPIAGSALARPHRGANAERTSALWLMTRATVFVHRLAGVLPERIGTGMLRSRVFTRVASVAMVKTRDRTLRRWIHAEHDRYFGGFADRRALLEAFGASVSHGVDEVAARVTVPTLLVGTVLDDITTPAEQVRLAGLFPDARLVMIDGTGHLVHYERPDAVAEAITRFLA